MKTYRIYDRIPRDTLRCLGIPVDTFVQPWANISYGGQVRGTDIALKAVMTGEYREPKQGEWYISGAVPEAYLAPNDLGMKHHIAKLAKVRTIQTETVEVFDGEGTDVWMRAKGWEFDHSSSGHERWTRKSDGNTAFRQPYMTEQQWLAHKISKANEPKR